jgi:hypothetical protein
MGGSVPLKVPERKFQVLVCFTPSAARVQRLTLAFGYVIDALSYAQYLSIMGKLLMLCILPFYDISNIRAELIFIKKNS